jgi:hypothetical protein
MSSGHRFLPRLEAVPRKVPHEIAPVLAHELRAGPCRPLPPNRRIRSTVGSDDGAMAPRPTRGLPMGARCRRSGTSTPAWRSAARRRGRAGFAGCAVLRCQ